MQSIQRPLVTRGTVVLFTLLLTCFTWFVMASTAHAASTSSTTPTSNPDIVIQRTERVHDILAIAQKVDVEGDVTDNLVAIDSTVQIHPGAHIDTLLVIGGSVKRADGSTIHNALIFAPLNGVLDHLALGIAFVSFGMILKFLGSFIIIFSSVGFSALLKPWLYRPLNHFEQSIRRSFLMGILISVGIAAATFGFAITGIGLPIAFLLALADVLLGIVGLSNLSVFVGQNILRRYQSDLPVWRSALVGSLLIVAGINIPVVGVILLFIVWCVGTSSTVALLNLNRTKR